MKTCAKARKVSPTKKSFSSKTKTTKATGSHSAEGRILGCLLREERISHENNVPRKKIALMAGVKPSTFNPLISKMKTRELIIYPADGALGLTEKGRSMADPSFIPASNETALEKMKAEHCKGGLGGKIFDLLADGREYEKSFAFEHTGCKSKSTWAPMLSKLKGKGVIHYPTADTIQLSDMCFPFGRPENGN